MPTITAMTPSAPTHIPGLKNPFNDLTARNANCRNQHKRPEGYTFIHRGPAEHLVIAVAFGIYSSLVRVGY
jgi:hypothetical protein